MKFFKYFAVLLATILIELAKSENYPSCHKNNLQWFPHQQDCSLYYLCHHGISIQRSCAPGLHFNNNHGQCMIPSEANCQLSCPAKDDPKNPIFLPDRHDCSQFFVCYNGIAIQRNCVKGLLFDVQNNWCNFEELVDCEYRGDYFNSTTTEISTTEGLESTESSESSESETEETSKFFDSTTENLETNNTAETMEPTNGSGNLDDQYTTTPFTLITTNPDRFAVS